MIALAGGFGIYLLTRKGNAVQDNANPPQDTPRVETPAPRADTPPDPVPQEEITLPPAPFPDVAQAIPKGFLALYQEIGARRGVDPDLLRALAIVESSERADAVRWNPPNDISVGLMQVLCIPDENGVCKNRLNVEGWPTTFDALKNPLVNLDIAAQIIAWNLNTFGFPKGIAVYNSWGAKDDPANGPFRNQRYVDKVLKHLRALKGA